MTGDSIRNSCDVFTFVAHFFIFWHHCWSLWGILYLYSVEKTICKLDTRGVRVNNMHTEKLIAPICPQKKGNNFDISTVHIYNHYYQYFVTAQKVSFLSSLFLLLLLLLGFCTTVDNCIKMRPKHLLHGKKVQLFISRAHTSLHHSMGW